jgi:3-oxoacyl-[acyl-carrier-protein] synthase-3
LLLVVTKCRASSITQISATCIIFGDGAGAVLLGTKSQDENGIQDFILRSDGSGKQYLHQKAGGSVRPASHETVDQREHYVFQDGQPVFKAAVKGMSEVSAEIMERNQPQSRRYCLVGSASGQSAHH